MGLFSKGTIEMNLAKYSFKPGEEIEGTVKIKMKKPKEGKELTVTLKGVRTDKYVTTSGVASSQHGTQHQTKHTTVYDFKMPLAGAQEYTEHEYPFKIMIPPDILATPQNPEGQMSEGAQAGMAALKVIAGGTRQTDSKLKWTVTASLDMPGLDLNKKQDITIY